MFFGFTQSEYKLSELIIRRQPGIQPMFFLLLFAHVVENNYKSYVIVLWHVHVAHFSALFM